VNKKCRGWSKEKLLVLPKNRKSCFVERLGNIIDEDLFVKKAQSRSC
jgi:hypothetical protein